VVVCSCVLCLVVAEVFGLLFLFLVFSFALVLSKCLTQQRNFRVRLSAVEVCLVFVVVVCVCVWFCVMC